MRIKPVVQQDKQDEEKKVEFYLQQEGDEVHLKARFEGIYGEETQYVISIVPSDNGLGFTRHSDISEEVFETDESLRIMEVV